MLAWMLAGGACRLHRVALWVVLAGAIYTAVRLGLFAAGWVQADMFFWLVALVASLLFHLWVEKTYGRLPGAVAEEGMKVSFKEQFNILRNWRGDSVTTARERKGGLIYMLLFVIFIDLLGYGEILLNEMFLEETGAGMPQPSGLDRWHASITLTHIMFMLPCGCLRGCANWVHEELPWLRRLHLTAVVVMLLYSLAVFFYLEEQQPEEMNSYTAFMGIVVYPVLLLMYLHRWQKGKPR